MVAVGPVEILAFLLVGTALVFFVFRGRVPTLALVLIVIVLSPIAAVSLLFLVGTVLGAPTVS
jgi:hypothetical protein